MSVKALFDVGFHSCDCWDRLVVSISRFGRHFGSTAEVLRGCGILSCLLVDREIALEVGLLASNLASFVAPRNSSQNTALKVAWS
jgi:hypothetical protein